MRFRLVIKYSVICIRAYLYGGNISMKKKPRVLKKFDLCYDDNAGDPFDNASRHLPCELEETVRKGVWICFANFIKKKKTRPILERRCDSEQTVENMIIFK